MFSEDGFLGCPRGVEDLRSLNDRLNAKVVDQLNESQELVMINSFARETNEYQFKTSLQDRIADIASWRWVFEDLSKRLDEAISTLHYEHNALRVVIERIQQEIDDHSREASRPGALNPDSDAVEAAILQEYNFLRDEKKNFEKLITELEKQTKALERTKKRIKDDILKKREALSVEESCASMDLNSLTKTGDRKKKKKKCSTLDRWETRCVSLKQAGLQALNNAVVTRQQVRGSRVHLSIVAQAYAAKVDSALRRRLHANTAKLEELCWQREEAVRDIKSLEEELYTAEKNFLETMEQERLVEARLADRTLRPTGELTRDEVDRKLRDELARLRHFMKHMRSNIERITSLQNHLGSAISRIDCCAEDISQVVRLDQDRMSWRLGEEPKCDTETSTAPAQTPHISQSTTSRKANAPLTAIKEEDEEEYPFDE
ncbi:uncharacterized protein LOC114360383 [Ostrinia furnacalis]|uniref:uncharacterized protein LOC114360383 n=1 Tax=Ostrinia furnacalis TaxID=93504 RepID=UPI00103DA699|nr:uncharacterized protein LOC114360383 [Ostrinia furnacalis]